MANLKEINVEYIGGDFSSRSIHELEGGISYYNYEGTHFRVFGSFDDVKAFLKGDPIEVVAEFDSEDDLDKYLEDIEICSVCGKTCTIDDECYEDIETGDSCCTSCCYFDEEANGYRKGSKLQQGLKSFYEDDLCPHCGNMNTHTVFFRETDGESYFDHCVCKDCGGKWVARYTINKLFSGNESYDILSEYEELLARENEAMAEFLEKQIGFSQENVSDIANHSTKPYAVHVVCDNELKHYSLYTKEEEAHASYLKLCKKWYSGNGLKEFAKAVEYDSEIEHYDGYYNSEEYNDACDSAHVAWEVLNV